MGTNKMSNQYKTDRTSAQAFRDKTGELGEDLSEMASIAVDAGRDQIGKLGNAATQNYSDAKEHLASWEGSMEAYVREHPIKSLLMAAGAGVVLSVVWRHR